jgi:hypothetical protein
MTNNTITAGQLAAMHNSDIPNPAGATRVDDWMLWDDISWMRAFDVQTFRDGRAIVYLGGTQDSDGTAAYTIEVERSGDLTAVEARALAVLLTAAADRVDQLTG